MVSDNDAIGFHHLQYRLQTDGNMVYTLQKEVL